MKNFAIPSVKIKDFACNYETMITLRHIRIHHSVWKSQKKSHQASGQTVLPDRSLLIRQKLVENTKTEKLKCDFLTFELFSNTVKHAKSTRGFVTYSVHICDKCHPRITWFEATTWSPLWSVSITTLTAAIPTKSSKNDEKIEKRDFVSLNNVEHQNKSFLSHFLTIIVDGGVVSRSLLFHPLYFLGFPFFLRHIPQSVLSISRAVKGSTDMWSNLELIFPIYRTLPDYR